ncbi:hypothetical protein [Plantactinospora sp. GCM10030261]|uniref:hypothetical protein n=1 Tax=Plantactinospora sp. GCM10030261 TaxID=3273420 RepID=UPI0036134B82
MSGLHAPDPDAGSDDRVELPAYRVARLVAPAVDRVFVAAMRASRDAGGVELGRRYGGPAAVGFLIDLRTRLAAPGGVVDPADFAAITRYQDPADCARALDRQVAHGMIFRTADGQHAAGGFGATERGAAFLAELFDLHAQVTERLWAGHEARVVRLAGVAARLVAAAGTDPGPAFAAVAPLHEPAGSPAGRLLLNRLGVLRYHRADAHAAAWAESGHTAQSVAALPPGPERTAIERDTDNRAAGPYAALTPDERLELLADLAALPG